MWHYPTARKVYTITISWGTKNGFIKLSVSQSKAEIKINWRFQRMKAKKFIIMSKKIILQKWYTWIKRRKRERGHDKPGSRAFYLIMIYWVIKKVLRKLQKNVLFYVNSTKLPQTAPKSLLSQCSPKSTFPDGKILNELSSNTVHAACGWYIVLLQIIPARKKLGAGHWNKLKNNLPQTRQVHH